MFGPRIQLFRAFGIPIRADLSWIILFVLVSWSLAVSVFPVSAPDLSMSAYWQLGVLGAAGLFISIVLHELAHARVAVRNGMPMDGITLFIFGGVAEMRGEPANPRAEFLVAIAGPIVTAALILLFVAVGVVGVMAGWPAPVQAVVGYLAAINTALLLFNLIPAFPLDGGRVLRSGLWRWKNDLRWATRVTSQIGSGFGIVLIILGIVSFISGASIGGLWWVLIGMFLRSAAQMSYEQLLVRGALEDEPVSRFMKSHPETVSPDATVSELVEEYVYRSHHKMYPVTRNGTLVGCVSTREIRGVPRERWADTRIETIARPCTEETTIRPDAESLDALQKMNRSGESRLLVVDGSTLRGILTLKDLLRFISVKLEIEDDGTSAGATLARRAGLSGQLG